MQSSIRRLSSLVQPLVVPGRLLIPNTREQSRLYTTRQRTGRVSTPTSSADDSRPPQIVQYPYFVPRNTLGSLPVYTDVRNAGGRYMVLIRNIEGNADALAKDLTSTLFPKDTPEASRIRAVVHRSKHLVLSGGYWKNQVTEWLRAKGF